MGSLESLRMRASTLEEGRGLTVQESSTEKGRRVFWLCFFDRREVFGQKVSP